MDVTGQRAKKSDEFVFFLMCEVQRPDLWIQIRILAAAVGIELDDLFEAGKTAVVHVRTGTRHFAQRRGFESSVIARVFGNREPSFVGDSFAAPRHTSVVKALIRKVWADVARATPAFSSE